MNSSKCADLVCHDCREVAWNARLHLRQRGSTTKPLHDIIVCGLSCIGSILTKTIETDINKSTMPVEQRFSVQSKRSKLLRSDIVHQHIGGINQRIQRRHAV